MRAATFVTIDGDSMEPVLSTGDRIMVDTSQRVPVPPGIFVIWDGMGLVAKRVEHAPNTATYLRRAVGQALDVETIGASRWTRMGVVAERYGTKRVFMLGDAVHQLSPTAALGMNTGIGDAVDLGWKLAAMLDGWGGDELLASYDAERRPVGHRNVGMSTEFHLEQAAFVDGLYAIDDPGAARTALRRSLSYSVETLSRAVRTMGLQLGYRYEGSPICVEDGSTPPQYLECREPLTPRVRAQRGSKWLPPIRQVIL